MIKFNEITLLIILNGVVNWSGIQLMFLQIYTHKILWSIKYTH